MRRAEYLLTVLQEECGEVVQAAAKIQRFSGSGVGPGESKTNAELLVNELVDVIAMIEMLERDGVITMPSLETIQAMARRKQAKVESYMRLLVEVGTLDPAALRYPNRAGKPRPSGRGWIGAGRTRDLANTASCLAAAA